MSVSYLIHFAVRPERLERFRELLFGVLDQMRHEENFRSAILHSDPRDPLHFMLHETWADHQDVIDTQLQRPYRAEWHAALPELLDRPREFAVWQPIRGDGASI